MSEECKQRIKDLANELSNLANDKFYAGDVELAEQLRSDAIRLWRLCE
jgi:hypothetical protein